MSKTKITAAEAAFLSFLKTVPLEDRKKLVKHFNKLTTPKVREKASGLIFDTDPKEYTSLAKCRKLKGKVEGLYLCKQELFYCIAGKNDISVYPVDEESAGEEAAFFGVDLELI